MKVHANTRKKVFIRFLTAFWWTGILLFIILPFQKVFPVHLFVVTSGSMAPSLSPGSVIIVTPKQAYQEGDIVTFLLPSHQRVTHRIIRTSSSQNGETLFFTKGDANTVPDREPLKISQIQGKVLFSIPFIGYLLVLLKDPLNLIALSSILFLGGIYSSLRQKKAQSSPLRNS